MISSRTGFPQEASKLEAEFTFVRELGRGGAAIVYLAHDRELDREVAIKLIRSPLAEDEETLLRFAREAKTAARLQHPHIVAVHSVKRLGDGGLALVMQYIPGRTLKRAIQEDGPFPFERAEAVLRQIGSALTYAHSRGVIHRDVKPENIFLDERSDDALLADFGIARTADRATGLTLAGVTLGTPAYMAPEQIDGTGVDARSDLFSLALLTWEMLTGEAPWEGESLYTVIYKQKHEILPSVREFRPDVPFHLRLVIEKALQKKPDQRFPDAAALLGALDEYRSASAWRRWRSALAMRQRVSPATPPPPTGDEIEAVLPETRVNAAETIRYQRPTGEAKAVEPIVAASLEAEEDTQLRASRRSLFARRPGLKGAAVTLALLLITGLGATLSALNPGLLPSGSAEAPVIAGSGESPATGSSGALASGPIPFDDGGDDLFGSTLAADSASLLEADSIGASAGAEAAALADSVSAAVPAEPAEELAAAAPPEPTPSSASFSPMIAAGGLHTCSVTSGGELFCWGGNTTGQLGTGRTSRAPNPTQVGGSTRFREVAAGVSHTCGLSSTGEVLCWGGNQNGQLGDGSTTARATPARVSAGQRFSAVRAGRSHSCGLTREGEVFCWGANSVGQLGDGTAAGRPLPAPIAGSARFTGLTAGWNHSCAVSRQGVAYCWGQNTDGQLGTRTSANQRAPAAVPGPRLTQVAAGGSHTCGLTGNGRAYCWGQNTYGQLGDGNRAGQSAPVATAGGTPFRSIAAGSVHTCGLTAGGEAYCWGRNTYGQLGDGSTTDRSTPVPVAATERFTSIHASGSHTCGTTRQGENFCWGYNVEGQIGDGTRSHRTRPIRIPDPNG